MDRGESLSQSTNRVVLREENLIYAPELFFGWRVISPGSTLVQFFASATSRRKAFARSSARFVHLFQMDGQSGGIHLRLRPF
jgi:hypothetical protein